MHSRIKLSARLSLNNSFLRILPLLTLIIFLVFVFSLCNSAVNFFVDINYFTVAFSVFSLVVFVFVISPARFSIDSGHFMLARGLKNARAIKVGLCLKKSLVFYPVIFCIRTFWLAVFEAVPVSATVMLYFCLLKESLSMKAAIVFSTGIVILAVSGLIFYSVFIQRYAKASFYLVCYEDFSAFDAIKESVRKTRDGLCEILFFKLSFLPWFLLCIGIVPMLFVIPYYKQSLTLYFINRTRCSR